MVGAPLLAAKAALRIGAGLVTIASTKDVTDKLEKRVEEIMTLATDSEDQILKFIADRKVNSLVIGSGLKQDELVRSLIKDVSQPMVIDGGGLGAIMGTTLKEFKGRTLRKKAVRILTPHAGEFKRLVGRELPDNTDELQKLAVSFAKDNSVILVLKGHPTYVINGAGYLYKNQTGGPALATAGTGDVLSGMIGGLITQGIEPFEAAKAAVYLHGLAGDLATRQKTQAGLIASDVIEAIPAALKNTK